VDRQHEHADQIRLRGSVGLARDASGAKITDSDTRYYPYGVTRPGLAGTALPTDRRFTGQRNESGLGFYDYNARQYDATLGRFLQADTLVPEPGNPQSLNRYAYTLNNPLRYTDPSGHASNDGGLEPGASTNAQTQLRHEQLENYRLMQRLLHQRRWNELRDFARLMHSIQPGSIGVLEPHGGYQHSGLGNVGHAVVGAGEGVFIGTGGARDTRGVYMSSAAAIWNDQEWREGLAIYEVQGLKASGRQAAAEFALDSYGAGYSYAGIVTGDRDGGPNKKWYCSELTVAALEQADVEFYTVAASSPHNVQIYKKLHAPTLPALIPGYRTIVEGGWWLTTTPQGNSTPLVQTWP